MSHESVDDPEPMFQPADVRSLRDMAYEDIRDAILAGALPPGRRVKERDVAAQMGISTTPVKEALRRLEQEGLVVSQPRRGAVVSRLVQIPVEEIEEIRGALEAIAARLAAERMSDAELARLRALTEGMTRLTLEMREPETRIEEVAEFHRLIRAGSRNDFIVRFVDTLTPFERVHRREYQEAAEARRILEEHQQICRVLNERNAAEAERLMLEHFDLAREYWRQLDRSRAATDGAASGAAAAVASGRGGRKKVAAS
jgi:DNA-binding GntR family transcriptional regulator